MLKLIILLAFVATVYSALSDPSGRNSQGTSSYSQAYASASASSSSSSNSATAASSASATSSDTFNNKARCKNNEEFLSCPNENCKARTCDQLGFPLPCFQINNNSTDCGKPGCYCKDGFVKNNNGLCIAQRDCPSCGGDNNAWAGYGAFCTTCDNYKEKNIPCPLILLLNGCDCRPNYVYDTKRNKCVLPDQCLNTYHCGENEVYDVCPSSCPTRTCETKDRVYKCEAALQPGDPKCSPPVCRCDNNYYRNNQGKCVLKEQCPPNCGLNEVVSDCANSPCIKNCATKDQNYQCKPYPPDCKPGCVCADGYFRNEIGICVGENECKGTCGENEVFSSCKNGGCDKRNCTQRLEPALCIDLVDGACIGGCVCQEGFLRTAGGKCVPNNECPSSEVCPKPHEYFDLCPASCPGRKCGTDDRLVFCVEQPKVGDANCSEPSCRCEEGFYRSPNGDCVTFEECPTCKGQFEEYSNCVNGGCDQRNCTQLGRPQICIDLVDGACEGGCVCQKGYLRNAHGICVPVDQCPKNEVCSKPHEYYDQCPASCPARQCGKDDRLVRCKPPLNPGDPNCAPPACRCESGYYRNSYGDCVTFEECPPICGENEVPFDCVNSPCLRNNCAQKDLKTACRRKPDNCKAGCICADGYLRANNGTCIPKDQCPSTTPTCGENEVLFDCVNSPCLRNNCAQMNLKIVCRRKPANCKAGCICSDGYLRANNGTCIPKDQCPTIPICKGQFEEYSNCVNGGCDQRNCTQLGRPQICIDLVDGACKGGCVCQKGYLRNSKGVCVPVDQCPKNEVCSKPHEYYDQCPASCPARQCGRDDSVVRCAAPLNPGDPKCAPPACRCESGYYRNLYGDCVTFEECSISCGQNEIYYPCPKPICANQTCENIGKIYDCPLIPLNYTCKGECRCQPGFYKNKIGLCITEEQCKKCTGDYEYFACGGACDNECEKLKYQSQKNCPIINIVCNPMCYCFEGYARDSNNTCIPISKCPPGCDNENEEYAEDPNKVCRPKTCDDLGFPLSCYHSDPKNTEYGKPGCICKSGLVRDKNGVCIPETECQTSTTPTTVPTSVAVAQEQFNLGSIVFNADFFNIAVQNNIGKSVIVSPYSTLVLLTQCALYAKELTLEQLLKTFNFDSTDKIREAIPAILDSINNQRNVTLSLVDRVYGNKRSSFSDAFKRDTEVIYKAEAENIDMTNGQAAADYMNKWVASKTNNKILDLIPGSLITPNTELVLVNAIYCLAEWRYKFDERNTRPDEFYISKDKNMTVDMMNQIIYINYTENKEYDAKAIELPYVNSNLTCLIILPNNKDGAPTLVSKLANKNAFKSIRESFKYERVSVSIPKFNSTTTTDLKDVLQKLHITELFNPDSNGLSGILADPSVNIFVTAGIQKANIIINESGSEASAANAIIGVTTSFNPELPKEFRANYSFPYYILFRGIPIFCGLFAGI